MLDFKSFGRLFHFHAPLYWILRDLQNFHPIRKPNLVINLLFIQSISKFLTSLPSCRISLKLWPISLHGYKRIFTLSDTPQKVDKKFDNIHQAICFGYSYISSVPLVRNSAILSSDNCVNATSLFTSLRNTQLGRLLRLERGWRMYIIIYTIESMVYCLQIILW